MRLLATLGKPDTTFVDRQTVKVVIRHNDKILLLNDGLLPGGGVAPGESDAQAMTRELAEELGARVANFTELGEVVQYRDFLKKRYIIRGYAAKLRDFHSMARPQDDGEAAFQLKWLSLSEARKLVRDSIKHMEKLVLVDDSVQGRLYNLQTTNALLNVFDTTNVW